VQSIFTPRFHRRIYLLRHADVRYFDPTGRPLPPNEVNLSEDGQRQARLLGRELRDVVFDRVVTSDLPRTQETAQILLEENASPPPTCEAFSELREIQPGRLADLPPEERQRAFLDAFAASLTFESRFLGGESFGEFFDRVLPCYRRLVGDRSWERLLLVAHGGVNRVLLMQALGLDLDHLDSLEQDPCCLNLLDVDDRARTLVRLLNHTVQNPIKQGLQMTTMEQLFLEYCGENRK